jgi:hypothetical protein
MLLRKSVTARAAVLIMLAVFTSAAVSSQSLDSNIHLKDDQPVTLRFFGSPEADLFSRELDESLQGVLEKNFVATIGNGFPAGFINASLPGHPWGGTMWSRDGGTFMRELVMRGYYQHAALLADCLINMVEKNKDGFYTFPRYFKGTTPGSGSELDGTASIVIGMELLWERLSVDNPTRKAVQKFLLQESSPVNYFKFQLQNQPLLPGSGEFGCGGGIPGECYNVVQNNLARLALLAVASMADQLSRRDLADEYRDLAAKIDRGMEKYLVAADGSWIWCIVPRTMRPAPAMLNAPTNKGIGSQNGVASMYADVLGLDPLASSWPGLQHNEKTLWRLYNTPMRKAQFERYGIWTQFDILAGGYLTSPSYGQGYAIQTMLLTDKLSMAGKALAWLVNATYNPIPEYKLHRTSPYYFYERTYSPDAVGKIPLDEGCGALNLVNVSEPLKASRIMLGVDDHSLEGVAILPRIPPGWKGVESSNWPIRTRTGIVRATIHYQKQGSGAEFTLRLARGEQIDDLKVRMSSSNGYIWREKNTPTPCDL